MEELLGVVEAGADGADGAADDVADCLVAEAVDLVEGDDCAVLEGEFLEGVVELLLQFAHEGVFVGVGLGDELVDEARGVVLVVHLFEAEEAAEAVFAQVRESGVESDAVEPGEEAGVALEAPDGLECLDEGVLGEVCGVLAVGGEVVDDGVDAFAVLEDELVEGVDVSLLHALHDGEVFVGFELSLGRRDQGLGDGLAEVHARLRLGKWPRR